MLHFVRLYTPEANRMAKTSRKLSLKRETLRKLDQAQLEQVGGGTNIDYFALKNPITIGSAGCQTNACYAMFNFNYWYIR
jgi:hypothetical protein